MKLYEWGWKPGTNQAKHSDNCLCSMKSWAKDDDCDCELQWLRNSVLVLKDACEAALEDGKSFPLSETAKTELKQAIERVTPKNENRPKHNQSS